MTGAVIAHLTILGIDHDGDGGRLFIVVVITLIAEATLLFQ